MSCITKKEEKCHTLKSYRSLPVKKRKECKQNDNSMLFNSLTYFCTLFWKPSEHVLGYFKNISNAHKIRHTHTDSHAIRLVIIDPNLMSPTRNNNHNNYQNGVTMMDNMLQLYVIIDMR